MTKKISNGTGKIISHPIIKKGHNIVLTIASILLIATLFYAAFFAGVGNEAKAGTAHNVSGWAWSDNIGWISFNCTDTSSCATVDYGVDLAVNGDLSGWAWSDNVGWVSFNDSAGCPQGSCQPNLPGGSNNLQGWARALSYGDGWDGWISLSGTASDGTNYGVTKNGNNLENYAWDASDISGKSIGIGWIDWSPAFGGVVIGGGTPQCSDGIDNDGDGLTDTNDPGCHSDGDASNSSSYNPNDNDESNIPQCSDGIDNDGNGCADFPNDSGCSSLSDTTESGGSCLPQCSNGIDDDLNGCADFPNDSGCSSLSDTTESGGSCPLASQCSDGIDNTDPEDTLADTADPGCYDTGGYDANDNDETDTLPQCSNFFDDDGDGLVDYASDGTGDPGCSSATDNRESNIGFEEF